MPLVSIIIVNWNTKELLSDCLGSLSLAFKNNPIETFVVDNGSTDGSQEMLKSNFPDITLIENGRNLGFAAANNIALQQAKGAYFLLLNSDTVMKQDSGDILIDFMQENPKCGFASPQLLNEDDSLQNTAANFPTLATELLNKTTLKILFPGSFYRKTLTSSTPIELESLVGASLMVRAEMTQKIGYYDEDFFFFLEETEWCLRGKIAGWKCFLVPDSKVYHLQGQTAKKVPFAVRIEYWRSRYTYFKKHYSKNTCKILMYGLLAKNTANLILNLLPAPFSQKHWHKVKVCAEILRWHFRGQPASMGLSENAQ